MIKKVKTFIKLFFKRAQFDLTFSQWVSYLTVLFTFLNAGNALCKDTREDWEKKSGPISLVNQSPIQLLFLQALPAKAETLPKHQKSLSLKTAITNTLLSEKKANYEGVVDMEMIRTSFELQYGILSDLEIGISLPLVYSYFGIMDHAILNFEKFFFSNTRTIREKEEPDKYEYFVKRNNKVFISGKGKRCSGMGDLALRVKKKIWDEGDILPCLSTRLAFKFPTGDKDRALGSGKPDYAFGLLIQKDISIVTFYLNADVIFPGDAFKGENISLSEFYEVMLGAEYRVGSRTSILAQVNYITRPFKNTGLQMLDRRIYDVLLGIHYLTEGGLFIQGGGIEDFNESENAGADITFFLNIGKNF